MKKKYQSPSIMVEEIEIEKGFATSTQYGINQLEYDETGDDLENTAW